MVPLTANNRQSGRFQTTAIASSMFSYTALGCQELPWAMWSWCILMVSLSPVLLWGHASY